MIPPGECMYAGRKRRKPVQKQRPLVGNGKSNPSKRHRDRLNAELDRLASLLPFPPEIISKLDKLSVLRLSVSYLRVKSFFQAISQKRRNQYNQKQPCQPVDHTTKEDNVSSKTSVPEGELLLDSLNGFALVVNAEGMIFYASSTIVDYLGFHQTDVMQQNIYDYIHVDDRQEFCQQLHWAMNPPQEVQTETGEEYVLNKLFKAQECEDTPPEYSSFLNRCFICRVRCLLDSTSGFLTMQFQGKLKFLFGQKKTSSGAGLPPQMALFCVAMPLLIPSAADIKMKNMLLRAKHRPGVATAADVRAKPFSDLCEAEMHGRTSHHGVSFSDMLHCAESQIKWVNSAESGISLLKARRNDDQWVWVEASTPLVYRNGCSECVIVPQQVQSDRGEEEHLKKQSSILGLKEAPLYNCTHEPRGQPKHLNWAVTKHEKEDIKLKLQPNKSDSCSVQDEPLNFCKPISGAQTHCSMNSWALRNASSVRPVSHHPSTFPVRAVHPFCGGNQSIPSCCPQHGGTDHFQTYSSMQHLAMESCAMDNIKTESASVTPKTLYDLMMPQDIPIKMEYDSDSENGAEYYSGSQGQTWPGENSMLKKQLLGFPDGLHLKTETDFSDLASPCQKLKQSPCLPHKGHCMTSSTHTNSVSMGRPFKAACSKDMGQFYPSKYTYLESNQLFGLGSIDDKGLNEQTCKLQCDFRVQSLAQAIKQEPLDSPPWPDSGHNFIFKKPTLPSSVLHKTTEFTFFQ
ncbi:aryl hydrocarbon receptor repressor [Microcaecilia unicolor]|uniref:Aryl hydrocarbon receptor repressor n=1 Tax=Microcaecilia unicolor TaxID=1415580 RepID=A0A6P7X5N3_9AMPH|nr:aryl hydrocarbon receptor repressor [Microcaecilia unicolor]